MAIRLCLAALLSLLLFTPAVPAGAPASATIVLELPASMPPAELRALIAELAAKGARPASQPALAADPTAAVARPALTTAGLAGRIWTGTAEALQSVPLLRHMPQHWVDRAVAGGATRAAAIGLWIVALAMLIAAPLIGIGMRRLADRRQADVTEPGLMPRLRAAGFRFLVSLGMVALYAGLFWIALSFIAAGVPIVEETADELLWATLKWRLLTIALLIVVSPYRPDIRLLQIDDADARKCARWITVYLALNPFNVFLIWFIERLGFGHAAVSGAAFTFGAPITLYKVAMFWAIRAPIARAICTSSCGAPSPFRRMVADSWHWLFIALAFAVFGADAVAFALGKGAAMAGAGAATQFIIVALAVVWQAGRHLIAHLFPDPGPGLGLDVPRVRFRRVLSRLFDALLWILGAGWLGETWGLDLVDPAPGSVERLFVRPAFEAAATIIGAWILWTALSAVIDQKIPHITGPGGDDDDATAGRVSRVGTLLPLMRNLVLIVIAVAAIIAALSTLGLNIGPLLAGLGVVGIAVGFGAQSLVRDVISGIFFLMEDAFRVGEYVDTGHLKGTVEGMSLRSVRLRHQNGQVHTIPFGQVNAVTNFSRDWAVIKFNLQLEPGVDIETVRRTVKRVGEALLDDPEFGSEFIQPLKMQGVVDVSQTTFVVRCKFTATPIRPTLLQRQALRRLIEAFAAAGIRFAAPNVMMQLASAPAGTAPVARAAAPLLPS
jgi:moderate conductance mechanosensitive channel